jgi:hypothetical protein
MGSRWLNTDTPTSGSSTTIINGFPDKYLKTVSWTSSLITITDQGGAVKEIPINTTDLGNGTNDDPYVPSYSDDGFGDHRVAGYAKQADLDLILEGSTVDLNTLAEVVGAYQAADTSVLDALNTKLLLYTPNSQLIDATDIKIGNGSSSIAGGVAVGSGSYANQSSVAFGPNAVASTNAVCVGPDSLASSKAVCVGIQANAGQQSVSIGAYSGSNTGAVAIGQNTYANIQGICLGGESAAFKNAIAVGYLSKAHSWDSISIGYNSEAGVTDIRNASIALGSSAKCHGDDSICIGNNSTIPAATNNTIVLGSDFQPESMEDDSLYIAKVRLDSSPSHIMYFNNDTKEVTYGINPRTLYGFMDVDGNIVRASVGVTSDREAAGKYRIEFPARNSEFYVVNVTVMNGGQSYTVVVANHAIDNLRFDVRNNSNNYVSRPLSFSITEIDV